MPKRKDHQKNRVISKYYYNTKEPAGFSGQNKIAKKLKNKVTTKQLHNWLQESDTYTLHKPVKKKFPRRKYKVSGIDATWQCDLTDLQSIAKDNDGYPPREKILRSKIFAKFFMIRSVHGRILQCRRLVNPAVPINTKMRASHLKTTVVLCQVTSKGPGAVVFMSCKCSEVQNQKEFSKLTRIWLLTFTISPFSVKYP